MTIIAIGGGGFTHNINPELDDFVCAQTQVKDPRIGYIGAANNDNPERIQSFYRRFEGAPGTRSHIVQSTGGVEAQNWVSQQDIIYVGGGDTAHLLHIWRKNGLDTLLVEAAQRGTVLAGVSAGAMCWFQKAYSTDDGKVFTVREGLGLVIGSCTPHYSTEPERPPAFTAAIGNGEIPAGIGIDDGVAVLVTDQNQMYAYSAISGANAYLVQRTPAGTESTQLEKIN